MGIDVDNHLNQLEELTERFCMCFCYQEMEEEETNDDETMSAWKIILRKLLGKINNLLILLKEEIAWSLLDDKKDKLLKITIDFKPMLTDYKYYEDEEGRKNVNNIILLIDEGVNGFRQSFLNDTYYEDLFRKELQHYRNENQKRIELIYKQDCQDEARKHKDENILRSTMLDNYRKQLFETRFGKVFHDQGRIIKILAFHITEQKEQDYKDINDFFDKFIAYEIAKEYCETKKEGVYKNIIFKDNVDVDKVMLKLHEFINGKIINAQRHWFVVYKIFHTKKWLKKDSQAAFIDQMNSVFYSTLKCSKDDFKEVDGYFKKKDYQEWTLDDNNAPTSCDKYKEIANQLDIEFEEEKYAKPGTTINTRKFEKFR